ARDTFPGPKPGGDALAALVLNEDVEKALEHEEAFLDLMGVGGVALPRRHVHDREREVLGRDHARIAMLAGAAGADEAMLRAPIALHLGVLVPCPLRRLLAEASDI